MATHSRTPGSEHLARIERLRRLPPVAFAEHCGRKAFEMGAIDRAIVLASQAYVAIFPFLIIVGSIAPRRGAKDTADGLIDRFGLTGSTAQSVRDLFSSPTDVKNALSWAGVIVLLLSTLSFTRSLQRVYELCFSLPAAGARNTKRGLLWLGGLAVYGWVGTLIALVRAGPLRNALAVVLSLAWSFVFFTWTPYVLTGYRVPWRRLVPIGFATTTGLAFFVLASGVYMPHLISRQSHRYGLIGVAFALLSWVLVGAFVIVAAAVIGSEVSETPRRMYRRLRGR
ncbi:MAG TPA: YhjD/YihY/BrkB family envelope integrity protein [Thermoleophilaceae bacterium]